MKTLTCAQMGGMCDTKISGATEEEIMKNGMAHLEESHPEMAATVMTLSPEDPMMVAWMSTFKAAYAAAPEE